MDATGAEAPEHDDAAAAGAGRRSCHADVAGDTGYALEYGRCTDDAAAGAVFEPPCSCNGIVGECCCSQYVQVSPRIIAPFIR